MLKFNTLGLCPFKASLPFSARVYQVLEWQLRIICRSIISLYSLYYAEACNEFTGPIFASLRPGNTAFEEMSQRWRAVGNNVSDFTGPRFEPQTSFPRRTRYPSTNASFCICRFFIHKSFLGDCCRGRDERFSKIERSSWCDERVSQLHAAEILANADRHQLGEELHHYLPPSYRHAQLDYEEITLSTSRWGSSGIQTRSLKNAEACT